MPIDNIKLLFTKKRIFIATLFLTFVVIIIVLLNLRIVSVKTNVQSEITTHHTDQDPVYPDEKTAQKTLVRWGSTFFVSARDDFEEARYLRRGGFPLNPFVSVDLVIEPQVVSSKVAANGDRCVLYDNAVENTIIVSDCITDTYTTVKVIRNGVRATQILSNITLLQSSPSSEGFYFVNVNDTDGDTFDINLYNQRTGAVEKILESQSTKPVLLTNEATGYFGGAVVGKAFYSSQSLSGSKKSVTLTYKKEDQSLQRQYGLNSSGLFVYSYQVEGQSDEDTGKHTNQTMELFNSSSGEAIYHKKASTKSRVIDVRVATATISLYTEDPNEPVKTFNSDGIIKTQLTSADIKGGLVSTDNTFYFVSKNSIWAISQDAKKYKLNLIYSADEINVTDIKKVGSKTIVSANSVKNGGLTQVLNFELDLNKKIANYKRIESILPIMNWSDNLLYADIYKNNIIVNYQDNNTSNTEQPTVTFSKIGIKNISNYKIITNDPAYFKIQNSDPTNSTNTNYDSYGDDEGRDDLNPDLQ